MPRRIPRFLSVLLKILGTLVTVAALAFASFSLILAQPQPDKDAPAEPQPVLTASPAVNIQYETELKTLVESFPAPVMSFMSGSGMHFVSGTCGDTAFEDGFARVATLYWQTADGEPLILQSIYPARALSLLGSGYHFSNIAGPTLFTASSVRMENADTVRLHAATDTGLYVMIVPKSLSSRISALSRSLQLFTVRAD